MNQSFPAPRFLCTILLTVTGALSCIQVSAQTDPCAIPGYPGCTSADFNRAMQAQQNQFNYQQQLQLQRRNNELLQEQNNILRQQQFQNNPANIYQQMNSQRCLSMPLSTPGC